MVVAGIGIALTAEMARWARGKVSVHRVNIADVSVVARRIEIGSGQIYNLLC